MKCEGGKKVFFPLFPPPDFRLREVAIAVDACLKHVAYSRTQCFILSASKKSNYKMKSETLTFFLPLTFVLISLPSLKESTQGLFLIERDAFR
jgi:hypothetical protein